MTGKEKELKQYIAKIGVTKDNFVISAVGRQDEFYRRFQEFKKYLSKELPMYSYGAIVAFHKHFYDLLKIRDWEGVDELMKVLELDILLDWKMQAENEIKTHTHKDDLPKTVEVSINGEIQKLTKQEVINWFDKH